MAAMQTTMIRASMTAYSTAVGPSSAFRNFTRAFVNLRISFVPLFEKRAWSVTGFRPGLSVLLSGPCLGWSRGLLSTAASRTGVAGGGVQRDVAERVAGIGAQRADGRDADDDDQRQHDRVLDGGRTIFRSQESLERGDPVLHNHSPCVTAHRGHPAG